MATNLKKIIGHNMANKTLLVGTSKEKASCMQNFLKRPADQEMIQAMMAVEIPAKKAKKLGVRNSKSGLFHRIIRNPSKMSRNYLTTDKKLLRMPGLKTYYNRPFGSSATSSMSSLHKRNELRRQTGQSQDISNFLKRMEFKMLGDTIGVNKKPARRNQTMGDRVGANANVETVSGKIRADLLPLDEETRSRISVRKKEIKQMKAADPFLGWKHPQPPEKFSPQEVEKKMGQSELEAQNRRRLFIQQQRKFDKFGKSNNQSLMDAIIKSNKEKNQRIAQYARDKKEADKTVKFTGATKKTKNSTSASTKKSNMKTIGKATKPTTARAGSVASVSVAKVKPKKKTANEISKNSASSIKQRIFATPNRALPTPTSIVCATVAELPVPTNNRYNRFNQFPVVKKF